jgi:hypothetical protein
VIAEPLSAMTGKAMKSGFSDLSGVRTSSDDDRAQDSPVRLAGVEGNPDPLNLKPLRIKKWRRTAARSQSQ